MLPRRRAELREACGRDGLNRQPDAEGEGASPPFFLDLFAACRDEPPGLCQPGTGLPLLRQPSEPIFNVPSVVTATIAALCVVYIALEYLLPSEFAARVFWSLAFVPARYD